MTTTQDIILDTIRHEVEERGFTLAVDRQYANTGTLRVYDKKLNLVGQAGYDFQNGYCNFGPQAGVDRVASLWYGRPRADGCADWVVGSVPELVDRVVVALTKKPA